WRSSAERKATASVELSAAMIASTAAIAGTWMSCTLPVHLQLVRHRSSADDIQIRCARERGPRLAVNAATACRHSNGGLRVESIIAGPWRAVMMRKQIRHGVPAGLVTLGLALVCARPLSAQDVAITNARIVVGNGTVINSGTVIVRAGKIVSVSAGAAAQGLKTIDAKGMTAMPGFIDAHRHINTGPNEKAQMQALLEAGYTTILSGGGPAEGNITLRDHIDKGVINGPRIIPSGAVRLNGTAEAARAEVRKLA